MARVWDVTKGKELFDLPHERIYWLHGIAFSPDGKHIVTLGEKRENAPSHGSGRLHVWDGAGGQPLRVVSLPDMRPRCLAVSPDGRWAAVGGYQALPRLYDLALGKEVRTFPGLSVYDLAFSPDGTMLAAACYGWTVRFWEVATGEEIFELGRTENLPKVIGGSEPQVAFSPDGRVVAATGEWT